MKKFEGVQLPGGVTLNGQKIYDEATEELQQLRDEAEKTFQLPVDFFTG
jgi:ABC-type phosphate transport system ATPase subunit